MSVMTLAQAKAGFLREHPNLRANGWDERDYQLWGQLQELPSYGLVACNTRNKMVALQDVVALLGRNAEARFEQEWTGRAFCKAVTAPKRSP